MKSFQLQTFLQIVDKINVNVSSNIKTPLHVDINLCH